MKGISSAVMVLVVLGCSIEYRLTMSSFTFVLDTAGVACVVESFVLQLLGKGSSGATRLSSRRAAPPHFPARLRTLPTRILLLSLHGSLQ